MLIFVNVPFWFSPPLVLVGFVCLFSFVWFVFVFFLVFVNAIV